MGNILQAVKIMTRIANDPSHGYDQDTRTGGVDFDCSSLVTYALSEAGYNITYGLTTHNMLQPLKNIGYIEVPMNSNCSLGDIFLNVQHHVCMVVSLNPVKVAEAVHNEHYGDPNYNWYHGGRPGDQLQTSPMGQEDNIGEIRIKPLYTYSSGWNYHLRMTTPSPTDWVAGNKRLTEEEKENNATIIYTYFYNKGYSLNAICGMLGNFEYESYLCPDKWEDAYPPYQGGYGLIQWTPYTVYASHYSDWHTNHNRQLEFINDKDNYSGNWIPTTNYPLKWDEFKVSNSDVDYLTRAYFYERERGTWSNLRVVYAIKWYNYFEGYVPPEPSPKKRGKGYKFYLFDRRRKIWTRQNLTRRLRR